MSGELTKSLLLVARREWTFRDKTKIPRPQGYREAFLQIAYSSFRR